MTATLTRTGRQTCSPRFATPRDERFPTLGPAIAEVARRLGKPLMPWQVEFVDVAYEYEPDSGRFRYDETGLTVPRQQGKGLAEDTLLPTPSGWVCMGDVRVGDVLFDEAGHTCRVTFVSERRWLDCYRVRFGDGTSVVADGDHLWRVFDVWGHEPGSARGGPKGRWVTASTRELAGKTMIGARGKKESRYRLPDVGPLDCPEVELPVDPWLFGAWLGDGTARAAVLTVGDRDVAEMTAMVEATGAAVKVRRDRTAWTVRFNINAAMRDGFEARMRRLGVWGAKRIPLCYLRASAHQRLALLQGLMDTDGTVGPTGDNRTARQCELTTTNAELAGGTVELLRSLGIRCSMREGTARLDGRAVGPKWTIVFTTDLPVFRLSRKAGRHAEQNPLRRRARMIHEVTAVPTVPTRCIQVDSPSALFRCGDGMVPTHNTTIVLAKNVHRLTVLSKAWGPQRLAYTAQTRLAARKKLERDFAEALRGSRAFSEITNPKARPKRPTEWRLSLNNGSEHIQLGRANYLQIDAPTRTGIHGDTLDDGDIDEAFAHEDDTVEASMRPTQATRWNAQIGVWSTAGDARSKYLWRKVLAGRAAAESGNHGRVCYVEYSAAEDADPGDPATWWSCMPALGWTIDESFVRGEWERAQRKGPEGIDTFRRTMLNQWPEVPVLEERTSTTSFDLDAWALLADPGAARGEHVVFGVDVGADRVAHVAVAWRRDDGAVQVMLADEGLSFMRAAARLVQLSADWKGPIMLGGPAAALEPDVRDSRVVSAAEFASACGRFDDLFRAGRLRHGNQRALSDSVRDARWRPYGTAGERTLDLRDGSAGPLAAVVRALHGLLTGGASPPASPVAARAARASETADLSTLEF